MCQVLKNPEIRPLGYGENAVGTPQDWVGMGLGMLGTFRNGTEFQACKEYRRFFFFLNQPLQ